MVREVGTSERNVIAIGFLKLLRGYDAANVVNFRIYMSEIVAQSKNLNGIRDDELGVDLFYDTWPGLFIEVYAELRGDESSCSFEPLESAEYEEDYDVHANEDTDRCAQDVDGRLVGRSHVEGQRLFSRFCVYSRNGLPHDSVE